MLPRRSAKITVVLAGCVTLLPGLQAADNGAGWQILKEQVTHRRFYEFRLREGRCLKGWIEKIDNDAVEVTISSNGQPRKKALARPDILHVSDNGPGLVYSGRSSWADVRSAATDSPLRIRIATKAGKTIEGIAAGASEAELTVKTAQGDVKTAKSEVARVELVRGKPWSDRAEFAGQELGTLAVLDPETWPYLLRLSATISVPLYDASVAEDNTEVRCAQWEF
jgi:hypothetical protein